jgi:leucyl-tRNA synthetase
MMVFVNEAIQAETLAKGWVEAFVKILFPFAPHITSEAWQRLGHREDLMQTDWPAHEEEKLEVESVTIAVQIDGKFRGTIEVPADVQKEEALETAKADEKVKKFLSGKSIRREVYVPGRLVNLVTKKSAASDRNQ